MLLFDDYLVDISASERLMLLKCTCVFEEMSLSALACAFPVWKLLLACLLLECSHKSPASQTTSLFYRDLDWSFGWGLHSARRSPQKSFNSLCSWKTAFEDDAEDLAMLSSKTCVLSGENGRKVRTEKLSRCELQPTGKSR